MLRFKAMNQDGNCIEYEYRNIDQLYDEYWSDGIDMDVPGNDDPINDCEFCGTEMRFGTFYDLVRAFMIDD